MPWGNAVRIEHRLEILSKALRQIREITALPSLDPNVGVVDRIAAKAIRAAEAPLPVVRPAARLKSSAHVPAPATRQPRHRRGQARKA